MHRRRAVVLLLRNEFTLQAPERARLLRHVAAWQVVDSGHDLVDQCVVRHERVELRTVQVHQFEPQVGVDVGQGRQLDEVVRIGRLPVERLDRVYRSGEAALLRTEHPVAYDGDQLLQVFLNLLKNAADPELRTLAAVQSGKAPGPESSFLKLIGTEIQQKIDALYVDAAGYYSLPFRPDQPVGEGNEIFAALNYFNHRKTTIFAGSNEIQRNIIAKHVLGL